MDHGPLQVFISKSKNGSKSVVADKEPLTLEHPMKLHAWAINIQSGIKLGHHLLIPVIAETHDWLQMHVLTGTDSLCNHRYVYVLQMSPVDGLHLSSRVSLGYNHGFVPVGMKPHPKPEVTLLLLVKSVIALKSQILELVLAFTIVDCPVAIVLCSCSVDRR